jgi:RNA polymerase sigma-70 factor, ECF subfamily
VASVRFFRISSVTVSLLIRIPLYLPTGFAAFHKIPDNCGIIRHLLASQRPLLLESAQHTRDASLLDEHEQLVVIRGLREGDRDAWAALYDAYSVDIWRCVARLLGSDVAAVSDVVQEVFMDAAGSARQFDPGRGTLWSWLVGIAHHRVSAHWRQTKRQARLQQMAEAGEVDVRHLLDGQLEALGADETHEVAEFVRGILGELSFEHAALLTAKYLDEQSLIAISGQFGGSVEAIKSKLARARQEFRAKFEFLTKAAETPANRLAAENRATKK